MRVVFFGDGAVEQGTFHESLNFASLHKLPVVFVMDNNDMSTVTPLAKRQANLELWKHAESYLVPSERIDGTKPEKIYECANTAVARAREGGGPTLLEIICERWSVHVLTNAAYIPTTNKKDPVKNFEVYAVQNNLLTNELVNNIQREIANEIEDALKFAKKSPYPSAEELYLHV